MYYLNKIDVDIDNLEKRFSGEEKDDRYDTEISFSTIKALMDSAFIYVCREKKCEKAKSELMLESKYSVPNRNFSDDEVIIWGMFTNAFRTNIDAEE